MKPKFTPGPWDADHADWPIIINPRLYTFGVFALGVAVGWWLS
jgi:hypothetical protein